MNQYVILPPSANWRSALDSKPLRALAALHRTFSKGGQPARSLRLPAGLTILDSIRPAGPKLIELAAGEAKELRAARPDLELVKRVDYRLALAERPKVRRAFKLAVSAPSVKLSVKVTSGGAPVEGARVLAFTNFERGDGDDQVTDAEGRASFSLGGASKKLARLYIFPKRGCWGRLERNFTLRNNAVLELDPIDLAARDGLRFRYPDAPLDAGANVRVAVLDAGVSAHKDLKVEKAVNVVTGEKADDTADASSEGHGTHVCGIIAARGSAPDGVRGMAPGVKLSVFRVVEQGSETVTNFAIAKGIDMAVEGKADLINLSLAGTEPDPLVRQAIERARQQGAVVIAASGNDSRKPVSFPASESFAIAVSAMGRKGTFPANSVQAASVVEPFGKDADDFVADFSNVGEEVDFVGPGVGIVSTVEGGYAALDGTSMACPAVTGAAASLLGRNAATLTMPRGPDRTDAILRMLAAAASSLGFEAIFEGHGLVRL